MPMSSLKDLVKSIVSASGYEIRRKPRPVAAVATDRQGSGPLHEELSQRFKNYHLGCGPILADDFLNIDGDFAWTLMPVQDEVVYAPQSKPLAHFLQYDLRKGIPAVPNSLQTIYHSHFLEHLSEDEGIAFLADCQRVLAPGGLMRFALPDFRLWCTNYVAGKQEFFDWYRKSYLGNDRNKYATHAAIFAGMLYNWGHRCMYDFEALGHRLADAGFTDIKRCDWGSSAHVSIIPIVEGLDDGRRTESVVVECRKPC
jgi:predicted SAM-dependent methyltransferase